MNLPYRNKSTRILDHLKDNPGNSYTTRELADAVFTEAHGAAKLVSALRKAGKITRVDAAKPYLYKYNPHYGLRSVD